jgi:hypothetical protein
LLDVESIRIMLKVDSQNLQSIPVDEILVQGIVDSMQSSMPSSLSATLADRGCGATPPLTFKEPAPSILTANMVPELISKLSRSSRYWQIVCARRPLTLKSPSDSIGCTDTCPSRELGRPAAISERPYL